MSTLGDLRDYYDKPTGPRLLRTLFARSPSDEVLVSTSIRLTKSLMDRVRARAEQAGVPATALMRQWIIDRLEASPGQAVVTVADLERFIATRSHPNAS